MNLRSLGVFLPAGCLGFATLSTYSTFAKFASRVIFVKQDLMLLSAAKRLLDIINDLHLLVALLL